MSYDLSLLDPVTREVLTLDEPHQMRGGTYQEGGTREARLNVTYNYAPILLRVLPEGSAEIFFHPAVSEGPGPWPLAIEASRAELDALLDPEVREILQSRHIRHGGFADLAPVG